MARLVRFELEEGGEVFVETADGDDQPGLVAQPGEAIDASHTFEQALSRIRPIASAVLKQVGELAVGPKEIEVEMGVTLTAEAGVIIAKTAAEGSLTLKLKWIREDPRPPAPPTNLVD